MARRRMVSEIMDYRRYQTLGRSPRRQAIQLGVSTVEGMQQPQANNERIHPINYARYITVTSYTSNACVRGRAFCKQLSPGHIRRVSGKHQKYCQQGRHAHPFTKAHFSPLKPSRYYLGDVDRQDFPFRRAESPYPRRPASPATSAPLTDCSGTCARQT